MRFSIALAISLLAGSAVAEIPGCLLLAINEFEHPHSIGSICESSSPQVKTYIADKCDKAHQPAATSAYLSQCSGAGVDNNWPTASSTTPSSSKSSSTGSSTSTSTSESDDKDSDKDKDGDKNDKSDKSDKDDDKNDDKSTDSGTGSGSGSGSKPAQTGPADDNVEVKDGDGAAAGLFPASVAGLTIMSGAIAGAAFVMGAF